MPNPFEFSQLPTGYKVSCGSSLGVGLVGQGGSHLCCWGTCGKGHRRIFLVSDLSGSCTLTCWTGSVAVQDILMGEPFGEMSGNYLGQICFRALPLWVWGEGSGSAQLSGPVLLGNLRDCKSWSLIRCLIIEGLDKINLMFWKLSVREVPGW